MNHIHGWGAGQSCISGTSDTPATWVQTLSCTTGNPDLIFNGCKNPSMILFWHLTAARATYGIFHFIPSLTHCQTSLSEGCSRQQSILHSIFRLSYICHMCVLSVCSYLWIEQGINLLVLIFSGKCKNMTQHRWPAVYGSGNSHSVPPWMERQRVDLLLPLSPLLVFLLAFLPDLSALPEYALFSLADNSQFSKWAAKCSCFKCFFVLPTSSFL